MPNITGSQWRTLRDTNLNEVQNLSNWTELITSEMNLILSHYIHKKQYYVCITKDYSIHINLDLQIFYYQEIIFLD
jgi:hypothetical protein